MRLQAQTQVESTRGVDQSPSTSECQLAVIEAGCVPEKQHIRQRGVCSIVLGHDLCGLWVSWFGDEELTKEDRFATWVVELALRKQTRSRLKVLVHHPHFFWQRRVDSRHRV